MKRSAITAAVMAAALSFGLAVTPTHAATITFDDVMAPTLSADAQSLDSEYAAWGVSFAGTGAVLDQDSSFGVTGFSPRNFVAYEEAGTIGQPGPMQTDSDASDVLLFSRAVTGLSFYAGSSLAGRILNVRAFDASNVLVSMSDLMLMSALQKITLSGTGIARLEYSLANADLGDTFVVDDLRFTPVPEPATMMLLGSGLIAAGFARRRQQRA